MHRTATSYDGHLRSSSGCRTQIAILGWGAWLVAGSRCSPAAWSSPPRSSASRALAPLEGTIEGWRSFIHARAAYARIRRCSRTRRSNFERLRLPRRRDGSTSSASSMCRRRTRRSSSTASASSSKPGEFARPSSAPPALGKSTLARMLVGSIIPTAGSVRLDMMDLRNWDPRQFGESVGYLPQDVQLFPASIKANIARMRDDARTRTMYDAAEIADVHEMIARIRARLRNPGRHGRQPALGRAEAADRPGARVLRQSAPARARRTQFQSRCTTANAPWPRRCCAPRKTDDGGDDHAAPGAAEQRRQDHDPASGARCRLSAAATRSCR